MSNIKNFILFSLLLLQFYTHHASTDNQNNENNTTEILKERCKKASGSVVTDYFRNIPDFYFMNNKNEYIKQLNNKYDDKNRSFFDIAAKNNQQENQKDNERAQYSESIHTDTIEKLYHKTDITKKQLSEWQKIQAIFYELAIQEQIADELHNKNTESVHTYSLPKNEALRRAQFYRTPVNFVRRILGQKILETPDIKTPEILNLIHEKRNNVITTIKLTPKTTYGKNTRFSLNTSVANSFNDQKKEDVENINKTIDKKLLPVHEELHRQAKEALEIDNLQKTVKFYEKVYVSTAVVAGGLLATYAVVQYGSKK